MRILIISPKNKTVFNFRGDLIRDMVSFGHEVYVVGPSDDFVEDILSLGVFKFLKIPFVKDNTSVKGDLAYLGAIKRIIKQIKPDIVFGYTIKPVIYGSIAAKQMGVSNVCAMVTGLGRVYASNGIKANVLRLVTKTLYKCAFKACNRVIFQNPDDIKELVSNKYLPFEKTALVNGSGVNMLRFAKSDLPKTPVFLMVSRIIREKGIMEYCEAARIIKSVHPEARFLLLGGFDSSIGALKKEDIQSYIDDGSIELCDEVKDPVSYYHKCSVFVLPSYYREGLPRTILEAMSCGRAVITTDWPGCREPIIDGENGYLIQIKNTAELADRMKTLIEDRVLLEKMSDASYQLCKIKYDVNIVNKQMKDFIGY